MEFNDSYQPKGMNFPPIVDIINRQLVKQADKMTRQTLAHAMAMFGMYLVGGYVRNYFDFCDPDQKESLIESFTKRFKDNITAGESEFT